MKKRIILFFIVILLTLQATLYAQSAYTRKSELGPISITYDQLRAVLVSVKILMMQINSGICTLPHVEYLYLKSDTEEYKFDEANKLASLSFPLAGATYIIECRDAPVSHIYIGLADYSRSIEIRGRSEVDISNEMASIESGFSKYIVWFGGGTQRINIGMICFFVAISVQLIFAFAKFKWRTETSIFFTCFQLMLLLYPWSHSLPGFYIGPDGAGFIERHSTAVQILGLISTFLTIGTALNQLYKRVTSGK